MKKSRIRFHVLLAALIFLVGVLPVWTATYIISQNFKTSRAAEYRDGAVSSMDELTTYLTECNYLSSDYSDPAVNSRIDTIGDVYGGHIMIARSDFKILRDNQSDADGRYLTMPGAIKCLSDRRAQTFRLPGNRFFIALPIFSQTETGGAVQTSDSLIATQPIGGIAVLIFPLDELDVLMESYANNTDIINLLWLLIMAALAPLATYLLLRPFDRMYQYFVRVGKGDYSLKEHRMGYRETDEITEVLNTTVSKLSEVDKARGEFVQNVSHELKTPLTSVKILADSLKGMDEVPIEMYREFISDISTEIDRENKIIEDLLSLVKMDKATQALNIEKVNVNQMLESILKRIAPIAQKDNIDVTLESHREVVADLDEVKMTLAITNIVENAIKYNYSGGWVHVTLDANHRSCIITISDSGAGIPEESIGQIFERFYRVDKARSREIGGTGLGLAITKSIIDLHHGEIVVESSSEEDVVKLEGVNQEVLENADVSVTGTVFTISLPLKYIRPQTGELQKKKGRMRYLGQVTLAVLTLVSMVMLSGCGVDEGRISENPYESVPAVEEVVQEGELAVYRPSLLLTTLVPYASGAIAGETVLSEETPGTDDLMVPADEVVAEESIATDVITSLIGEFSLQPEDNRSLPILPEDVLVLGYGFGEAGDFWVSLSENYLNMRADREILARKAIVKTLVQLPEISSVSFYIGDNPMAEADGSVMQPYTEDSFVDE